MIGRCCKIKESKLYEDLLKEFPALRIEKDFPLKNRTSFKVGGSADIAATPSTIDELDALIKFLRGKYHYCVLGGATNVLISDKGFRGVIVFTEKLKRIKLFGSILRAECGVRMGEILKVCKDNSLSGLEFACGIPGTVGGMTVMNAGCFNKSFSDVVSFVIAENGVYNNKNCCFDYRDSRFMMGETVYEVGFKLKVSEAETIDSKIEKFSSIRRRSQPKGYSCGSCFLNEGFFAGKVIDQAGLKGFRVGGAYISEAHANFVINSGGTAQNIYDLIKEVKRRVLDSEGIELHEELRYIGEFE